MTTIYNVIRLRPFNNEIMKRRRFFIQCTLAMLVTCFIEGSEVSEGELLALEHFALASRCQQNGDLACAKMNYMVSPAM